MVAGKSGLALLAVTAAMLPLLGGSGCSRTPKTEPLKLVFGEHCKQENDRKRVAIDGYVRPSGFLTFCDNNSCRVDLFARENQLTGSLSVSIPTGDDKSEMKPLKKDFSIGDFVIMDDGGTPIKAGEAARFIGELHAYKDPTQPDLRCSLDVDEVQKLEPAALNLARAPEAAKLSLDKFCDPQFDNKYVVIEGIVSLPAALYCRDECSMTVGPSAGADESATVPAYFSVGSKPGQMEHLPKSYQPSDLKIRDASGKTLDIDRTIRLFGVRTVTVNLSGPDEGKRRCALHVERAEQGG